MPRRVRGDVEVRTVSAQGDQDIDDRHALVVTRDHAVGDLLYVEQPAASVGTLSLPIACQLAGRDLDPDELGLGHDFLVAQGSDPFQALAAVVAHRKLKIPSQPARTPHWKMADPVFRAQLESVYSWLDGRAPRPQDLPDNDTLARVAAYVAGAARRLQAPYNGSTFGWAVYTDATVHVEHACDPNCVLLNSADGAVHAVALRPLKAGDTVTARLMSPYADMRLGPRLMLISAVQMRECTCTACCIAREPPAPLDWSMLEHVLEQRALVAVRVALEEGPAMLLDNKLRTVHQHALRACRALASCQEPLWGQLEGDAGRTPTAGAFTRAAADAGRLYVQTALPPAAADGEPAGDGGDMEGLEKFVGNALEAYARMLDEHGDAMLATYPRLETAFYRVATGRCGAGDGAAEQFAPVVRRRLELCQIDSALLPRLTEIRNVVCEG
jgi:hypothetical protein